MAMTWFMMHPRATPEMLGFIPDFLDETDPRPAREQINENYSHGGGWMPSSSFVMIDNNMDLISKYPEDPPLKLIATTKLRDETVALYEHDYLVIIQVDGSWEVARID